MYPFGEEDIHSFFIKAHRSEIVTEKHDCKTDYKSTENTSTTHVS